MTVTVIIIYFAAEAHLRIESACKPKNQFLCSTHLFLLCLLLGYHACYYFCCHAPFPIIIKIRYHSNRSQYMKYKLVIIDKIILNYYYCNERTMRILTSVQHFDAKIN